MNILSVSCPLNNALMGIDTVCNFFNGCPHGGFSSSYDFVCQIIQGIKALIFQHFNNFLGTDMVGCHLGSDISCNLFRSSHIPADHVQKVIIEFARIIEFAHGNINAFFKHLPVVGRNPAPDIGVVEYACRESDRSVLEKYGAQDTDIIEMPCQKPGVIDNKHISLPVIFKGHGVDDLFYTQRHGTSLSRRAESSLYQFLSPAVREHAGVIVGIP